MSEFPVNRTLKRVNDRARGNAINMKPFGNMKLVRITSLTIAVLGVVLLFVNPVYGGFVLSSGLILGFTDWAMGHSKPHDHREAVPPQVNLSSERRIDEIRPTMEATEMTLEDENGNSLKYRKITWWS